MASGKRKINEENKTERSSPVGTTLLSVLEKVLDEQADRFCYILHGISFLEQHKVMYPWELRKRMGKQSTGMFLLSNPELFTYRKIPKLLLASKLSCLPRWHRTPAIWINTSFISMSFPLYWRRKKQGLNVNCPCHRQSWNYVWVDP